ncbi:hypothetical protein [[Mycoplasma] mobile]|uniref:Expressed protein n=1 Tax=Mycoplasma mobile (strain ATCC 43663 / 163K / NCTC 11711) TaxID=267748 RepID=Q6KII1_MYCM1|nr:hypothetical protein [[Mycoplasma] mobile]AAT27595.1 expressed protein [Mycoplasma mobile 163K]
MKDKSSKNKNIIRTILLDSNEEKFYKIQNQVDIFLNNLNFKSKANHLIWILTSTLIFLLNIVLLGLASFTLGVILNDSNIGNSLELILSALVVFFTIFLFILLTVLAIYKSKSRFQKFKKAYQELEYLLIKSKMDIENYNYEKITILLENINDIYLKKPKNAKTLKVLKSIFINESSEDEDD